MSGWEHIATWSRPADMSASAEPNGALKFQVNEHIWWVEMRVESADFDLSPAEFSKRFLEPAIAAIMCRVKDGAVKP